MLIWHIKVKVQEEGVHLQMSVDGATYFILWSKDSDTWDVRCMNTWLVQTKLFTSCYQMVVLMVHV
jgi:hypothetical protein